MRYKNDLAANENYSRNVSDALSWMNGSDTKMQTMVDIMKTIKEKTVQAANETNTEKDVAAVGEEVNALVGELVSLANSELGGRYLFGGQRDTVTPFTIVSEETERADVKTLDDTQTSVFGFSKDAATGDITQTYEDQMMKLTGSDGNSYYMNVNDYSLYTADFVENGYKTAMTESGLNGKELYDYIDQNYKLDNINVGQLFSTPGETDGLFNSQGTLNAGKTMSATVTVDGQTVTFDENSFDIVKQKTVVYSGDNNKISMKQIEGPNDITKDAINATGVDVFGTDVFGAGGASVLNDLYSIVKHMEAGDTKWLSADGIKLADNSYEQVLAAQSDLGAICANYTMAQEMFETQNTLITEDITNLSGTDVAELAVDLQMTSMIYNMSLAMGSKILQNSLADYL
jgi:flagellar hook-associated protein 3 FlgL